LPILSPEIQKVLKSVGLADKATDKSDLAERLNASGLSLESTLSTVSRIMDHGDSDVIQLQAANTSLKLHGLMKDAGAVVPSVTIIIRDSAGPIGPNPILIPREAAVPEETIQ